MLSVPPRELSSSFICSGKLLTSIVGSFTNKEVLLILESGIEEDLVKSIPSAESYVVRIGKDLRASDVLKWLESKEETAVPVVETVETPSTIQVLDEVLITKEEAPESETHVVEILDKVLDDKVEMTSEIEEKVKVLENSGEVKTEVEAPLEVVETPVTHLEKISTRKFNLINSELKAVVSVDSNEYSPEQLITAMSNHGLGVEYTEVIEARLVDTGWKKV